MSNKKALLIVDVQNDFCPGGSLAVPGSHEIIPLINQLQNRFDLVVATLDWHPEDHTSFAANHPDHQVGDVVKIDSIDQILWPVHCVQESIGAQFHPQLETASITKIIHKGVDKQIDSYSAFFDNEHLRATGLSDYLRQMQVKEIVIVGLATDYCVKFSALDAAWLGFDVAVVEDACRGVDLQPNDIENALADLRQAGVRIIQSNELVS